MNFDVINVVAELERCGVQFVVEGDSVRIRCPFHDDASPSCLISQSKRAFTCMSAGCNVTGGLLKLLAKLLNTTVATVAHDLAGRYPGFLEDKHVDPRVVEEYHAQLNNNPQLVQALKERGMTDALMRWYRIGATRGRVTIPIKAVDEQVVNIRFYLPGGPSDIKMKNLRGFGRPDRLFPIDQLKYDSIMICGGEVKAMVAADLANTFNVGAISSTGSESRWSPNFSPLFEGKRVWVCFDIDKGGIDGAEKVCYSLKPHVRWIGIVKLPISPDKYPKGDINDWIGREGATADDLHKLLEATNEWEPAVRSRVNLNGRAISLTLQAASRAETTGVRITTSGVVAAVGLSPYVVPKTLKVICDRSQNDLCQICPVFTLKEQEPEMGIHPESPSLLDMADSSKRNQRLAIMEGLGIPGCKVVDFQPIAYYNIDDVRLTPQLELSDRSSDRTMQPAMCVDASMELNEAYELTGRMWPHPKNQQATLLLSTSRPIRGLLDSEYQPLSGLDVFQSDDPESKLNDIYADFEDNVTGIRMRRDMHLCMDLAWHSVLLYGDPESGRIEKGWVEVLVLGDSSQGKSEMARRLMSHYGCGEKVECKNATVAGLLGGLQQIGSRWFVTWGAIPTHDRRLAILEELKGASVDVLSKLTDMRSSGIAEIPKIERRRTHARTRIIALSNPRSTQPLVSYSYGVVAVQELMGGLEDIRRFDLVCMVSSQDIDHAKIHVNNGTPHRHTADLCHSLVLWAWTRTVDQVKILPEAISHIAVVADRMCKRYVETIPIVDRGSMRHKIGRMSTAMACRLYSTDDGRNVLVKPVHVEAISRLLDRLYTSKACGYDDYSAATSASNHLIDAGQIRHRIRQTPFPKDLIEQLLSTDSIELQDFQDWCGWERGNAQQLLSFLVRKHALHRDSRCYRKIPAFIDLLKGMRTLDLERPDYIDEKDEF